MIPIRLYIYFCTCCDACADACQTEIDSEYDFGMKKIKGAYLPFEMAFPARYVIAPEIIGNSDADRAKEVVDVPTASFNDVVKRLKPNVILMDIEGGELDVLEHANLNAMTQLRGIVIEFHPDQYEVSGMRRCKNILREAGFERIEDLSTRTVWVAQKEAGQV